MPRIYFLGLGRMRTRCFLFAVLIGMFFTALGAHAAGKYLYAIGGSGDPPGATTIFDYTFGQMAKAAANRGWQPTVLFDGDHKDAQGKVAAAFGKKELPTFSPFSFASMLNKIKADVELGKFKKGDQVLFWIDAHGRPRIGSQRSHAIACGKDFDDCNLDELQEVISKLESKGVKVALMDGSCYSGSSLNLGSEKTCIVTITSDHYVGFGRTANQLLESIPGTPLEQAFFNVVDTNWGYPQISTKAGKQLHDLFAPLLIDPIITGKNLVNEASCADGPANSILANRKEIFQLVQDVAGTRFLRSVLFQDFWSALKKYEKEYDKALKLKHKVSTYDARTEAASWGKVDWFSINQRDLIKRQTKALGIDCSVNRNTDFAQKLCAFTDELDTKFKMLENNPEFQSYRMLAKEFEDQVKVPDKWQIPNKGYWSSGPLERAARKVRQEYRTLYQALYREISKTSTEPEPCREFTF